MSADVVNSSLAAECFDADHVLEHVRAAGITGVGLHADLTDDGAG